MKKNKYNFKSFVIDFIFQDSILISRLFSRMPLASILQPFTRFLLESSFTIAIIAITPIDPWKSFSYILTVVFTVHILFWFTLGHGLYYVYYVLDVKIPVDKKLDYIYDLKEKYRRIGRLEGIAILLYGGITRGSFDQYSDIDLFVFTDSTSLLHKVRIYFTVIVCEKIKSLTRAILLDIDLVENPEYLQARVAKLEKEKFFFVLAGDTRVLNYLKSQGIPLVEYEG